MAVVVGVGGSISSRMKIWMDDTERAVSGVGRATTRYLRYLQLKNRDKVTERQRPKQITRHRNNREREREKRKQKGGRRKRQGESENGKRGDEEEG